jgi:cytochrome P450
MLGQVTADSVLREACPVQIGRQRPRGGLLGQLPELSRDPLGLLSRSTRDYGDFVRLRFGLARVVLLGHPDLVEEVLVRRSHNFRKHVDMRRLRTALGNGLLVSEGSTWLHQRRLMQPAFHRRRIDSMASAMVSTVSNAIRDWQAGETRDVYAEMTNITLKIAARTLLGIDIGEDVEVIRRSSLVMTAHLRSRLFSLMMLVPDNVPTPGNLRYAAAIRNLDALVYRVINQRRAAPAPAGCADLLGMLLGAHDETGRPITDRQVRDEIFTMISASYDTTALALTWAWVLLARNPAARLSLHDEIDSVLNGREPTAADAPKLTYVEHVVAETLRLYPSAWAIGREAVRDTHIGGQRVRKGTTVLFSPWVLHRDRRFFDDPDAFRPERWTDAPLKGLHRFAYVPYGAGQRTCLGSPFARLELTLALATIAQRFRLDLADPTERIEVVPVLTLQPRGSVRMMLTRA